MIHLRVTSRLVVLALAAALPLTRGVAAEPVEVPVGDLVVVRTASAERWYLSPHGGDKRNVLVVTVATNGDVTLATQPLPDKRGDTPSPDPPPPSPNLTTLVRQWAAEVNDPERAAKLAEAYETIANAVAEGKIKTPEQIVQLQGWSNLVLLGSEVAKWNGFLSKLREHLNANPPADMAAYERAWRQIAEGLR